VKHIIVVGGGFAGAAAATALAERGLSVTLLEGKAALGGRASSFRDGVTGEEVDNGQHLFMGCYRDTRAFLRRLKVEDRVDFSSDLEVPFFAPGGKRAALSAARLPAPWGLLAGFFRFDELRLRDKLSLLRMLVGLKLRRKWNLGDMTVTRWLNAARQTSGARRAFWTPLCLATLNEHPDKASAEALAVVLRDALFGGPADRAIGHASTPLGKLWSVELSAYLIRQGGTVAHRQAAKGFVVENGRVTGVKLESGDRLKADAVISAVPLLAFLKICPAEILDKYAPLIETSYTAILAVNLWFSKPFFAGRFGGLLDTRFHWAFNRHALWAGRGVSPGHLCLVMSGVPASLANASQDALVKMALEDIGRCFPDFKEKPTHATAVWERQATPSATPSFWRRRPSVATGLANFFLAGDWVDAGLPPTIEAACRSGHAAAAAALAYLDKTPAEEIPC